MTTESQNSDTSTSFLSGILESIKGATELFTSSKGLGMMPNPLSEKRIKLASLYCSLGECVAEARKESDMAEFDSKKAKLESYKAHRSENKSGVDSKAFSEYEALELTKRAIELKYNYERLKNIHDGTSEMLNAMSSRLRVLEGEKRNS